MTPEAEKNLEAILQVAPAIKLAERDTDFLARPMSCGRCVCSWSCSSPR